MKYEPTPIGEALERVESVLESEARAVASRKSPRVALTPEQISSMISKELLIRESMNQILRAWIEHRTVGLLADDVVQFFYDRLNIGEQLIRWLRSGGCSPDLNTSNEVLDWILVQSWPVIGVSIWKDDVV